MSTDAERIAALEARLAGAEQNAAAYRSIATLSHTSKIYPKKNHIIFVGRKNFSDNVKYAFLAFHASKARGDIGCHYFTDNAAHYEQLKQAGLPVLPPLVSAWSEADAKLMLSAKIAVLADNLHPFSFNSYIPYALLQGAKFVQLWHGIPLKEIGLQNLFSAQGGNLFLSELLASCGPYECLVAPSAKARADWAGRFAFNQFAPIGYPRNDVLLREASPHELINTDTAALNALQAAKQSGRKIIFYAPTFRDHIGPNWITRSALPQIAAWAKANNHHFLVNLHPFEQGAVAQLRAMHPDISFLSEGTDAYPLLRHADVLMTDYSSLAFDFLLTGKPLLFYRPDHDEYIARARGLIAGREDYCAGPIVTDSEGAIAQLATILSGMDEHAKARSTMRAQLFDHADDKAGARFCDLILKLLKDKS